MNADLKALFRSEIPKGSATNHQQFHNQNFKYPSTKNFKIQEPFQKENQPSQIVQVGAKVGLNGANLTSLANSGLYRSNRPPALLKGQIINLGENVSFAAVKDRPVFTFHDGNKEKLQERKNVFRKNKLSSKVFEESKEVENEIDEDEMEWNRQRSEHGSMAEINQKKNDSAPFCTKCRIF